MKNLKFTHFYYTSSRYKSTIPLALSIIAHSVYLIWTFVLRVALNLVQGMMALFSEYECETSFYLKTVKSLVIAVNILYEY